MNLQRFVSRRHAGHEHGAPGGLGARSPSPAPDEARLRDTTFHVSHQHVDRVGGERQGAATEHVVDPLDTAPLARGAADGAIVYFDAPSGAGGDMLVASLVDLGTPWPVITQAIDALGLSGVTLELRRGQSGALSGLRFVVGVEERDAGSERSYAQIRGLIEGSRLSPRVAELSSRVFERLARAEARAHAVPLDEVHFHEVGAVDSIVDIVGVCVALDYLGGAVWCSPLPLGRGFVTCRHGVIPLPAPATVECLIGLETYDGGVDKELVTPTAAAVLGALSNGTRGWPRGVIGGVGWGRGSMVLPDRPNLVRAVIVRPPSETAP